MRPEAKVRGPRRPIVDRFSPYLVDEVTFSRSELLAARATPEPAADPSPKAAERRRAGKGRRPAPAPHRAARVA